MVQWLHCIELLNVFRLPLTFDTICIFCHQSMIETFISIIGWIELQLVTVSLVRLPRYMYIKYSVRHVLVPLISIDHQA